ncbi:GlsB/YeaQ/YmgE family stress response membrane protein [Actinomyces culturomici]|uniref:GlsB/YeaQ/YmgE family stress response membrane protein n=1 Tax=Actinomyces culturomici TaxID=1926276 RepID=UPI000E20BF1F|nr:GlsB/YeaQ/YmgE family stress response membrane protein [Actinomyces culturomici]
MGILGYIILGLIVGAIAKAIMPGRAGGGWGANLLIGVVGAIVGGWLGNLVFHIGLGSFWNLRTWILSILGAVVVLAIWGAVTGKKN